MSKIKDLAEFGLPDRIINTAKISFTSLRQVDHELVDGTKVSTDVLIVCDGAELRFEFKEGQEARLWPFGRQPAAGRRAA